MNETKAKKSQVNLHATWDVEYDESTLRRDVCAQ
jgi:hypothetical protein